MTDQAWVNALSEAKARAHEIEEERRIPADLAATLADTGIFKLWVAQAFGGAQATVQEGLDAIEDAAFHDGSTGWAVMIANTTALMSGKLTAPFAAEIFGAPNAVAGGFAAPVGVGTLEDDGMRVTGQWAWGSGSTHCTSIGGGVRFVDCDGEPAKLPDGSAATFAFFDVDDVEFLDTWHVSGLKGSASTDYKVTNAFVPFGRCVALDTRQVTIDAALYNYPTMGALACGVASVAVGLARRAVIELVELAAKVPQGSARSLAERPVVQAQLAQAEANRAAGWAFLKESVAHAWDTLDRTGAATIDERRQLRLAAVAATRLSAEAVDLCYSAGGGTSVYNDSALQRVFRDVHVATQHGMVADRVLEPIGRLGFGLPTNAVML
jgi:alkylation response protein AidB-like acyl-CoA dehydrogenase